MWTLKVQILYVVQLDFETLTHENYTVTSLWPGSCYIKIISSPIANQ